MFVTRHIPTDHQDLIHDVSYDFHGRRMATCSTDQTVQIWDLQDNGEWKCTASWKSHSGSVWRVTWAHPEFGQVIATCSFDRTVSVWEECVGDTGRDGVQSNWIRKTSHVDSRTSIMDVKFAPKHLGLLLATCSADGIVRIYEAPDVMNLSQWSLQHEIMCKISCSCISWNPSRMHAPMIAVGSDDPSPSAGGKCQIYEFNSANRKWNKVESLSVVTDPVHDVAFAPNLGRSHHLLAIASKDLKIISLTPYGRDAASTTQGSKFKMQQVADFSEHESQVWRLSWNVTGTILCSSGDDGCVRLWKANYLGSWKCIAVLKGDGSQVQQMDINQSSMSSSGGQGQSNSGVRGRPPPGVMNMNIKRNSGWPLFNTQKDQGKAYY